MSRARKLCEELNAVVKEHGTAYLMCNYKNSLTVTVTPERGEIITKNTLIMEIYDEISEETLLDRLLMIWEDECDSCARHLVPSYLWAIRNRLWSDYNVD